MTNVTVEIGYASPPPPSPAPPPPGAPATLAIAATAWALGASPYSNVTSGETRVDYVSAAPLTGTWRTNRPNDISMTATFSDLVTGFTSSSVSISGGGSVYNFTAASDGATYSFGVRPSSTGSAATLVISIAAGVATTSQGGSNLAASLTLYYDPTPPVPVLRSNASKGATAELYIAFALDYGEVRCCDLRLASSSAFSLFYYLFAASVRQAGDLPSRLWGPFVAFGGPLGAFGGLWGSLKPCGAFWGLVGPFGAFGGLLGPCGPLPLPRIITYAPQVRLFLRTSQGLAESNGHHDCFAPLTVRILCDCSPPSLPPGPRGVQRPEAVRSDRQERQLLRPGVPFFFFYALHLINSAARLADHRLPPHRSFLISFLNRVRSLMVFPAVYSLPMVTLSLQVVYDKSTSRQTHFSRALNGRLRF